MPDPLDLYSFQRGLCLQQGPFYLIYSIYKFSIISVDDIVQRRRKTVDFPGLSFLG